MDPAMDETRDPTRARHAGRFIRPPLAPQMEYHRECLELVTTVFKIATPTLINTQRQVYERRLPQS